MEAIECESVCVCAYRKVRSQTTEGVREARRGKYHSGSGGCSAGDCAAVVYGVAEYYVGDYGYETFGGKDCGTTGDEEDEGYHDDGGCVGSSECEKERWMLESGGIRTQR